ncbi:MAG: quinone-dependent dihydroorotate dehydrogenase [Acidiferrobacterales bacterium]|nr:quinone-dependent dihydroorotate dehydrogenase [Acidiferrobacterales bacterium]
MYSLIKPIVFALDPEKAHDLTLANLEFISKRPFLASKLAKFYANCVPDLPVTCMGLDFNHPIGLAAGLDKDARAFAAFSALGFSAVEMGTVTPLPQPGNDKPRMFRLVEDQAIINRMGFNSGGVECFLNNLKANAESNAVAGINIGKNAVTAIEDAHFDYVSALQRVYSAADYISVNISSPNTKSLRELQNENFLDNLLTQIKKAHAKCAKAHKRHVPIALKVAPDLSSDEIEVISELLIFHKFDALIATNTTISRPDTLKSEHAEQGGGLSGTPVRDLSTECIREFYRYLNGRVQIIGVGGIKSVDDAWQKLLAGADYLQIYSMFIYQGPAMIKEIVQGLKQKVEEQGYADLSTALAALRS